MKDGRQTFTKAERLTSYSLIKQLSGKGKNNSLFHYPFIFAWNFTPLPADSPAQVVFSIPRKKFRRAVDRNRIRRQMREIYRLHKDSFYNLLQQHNLQAALMFIFVAKEKLPYPELEQSILSVIEKFKEHIKNHSG